MLRPHLYHYPIVQRPSRLRNFDGGGNSGSNYHRNFDADYAYCPSMQNLSYDDSTNSSDDDDVFESHRLHRHKVDRVKLSLLLEQLFDNKNDVCTLHHHHNQFWEKPNILKVNELGEADEHGEGDKDSKFRPNMTNLALFDTSSCIPSNSTDSSIYLTWDRIASSRIPIMLPFHEGARRAIQYRAQLCRYGTRCTNKNCKYLHPERPQQRQDIERQRREHEEWARKVGFQPDEPLVSSRFSFFAEQPF